MRFIGLIFISNIFFVLYADLIQNSSNDYYMNRTPTHLSTQSIDSAPSEHCWYEQVPISGSTSTDNNTPNVVGAVVGGIIGGVVGHQFGSGSGNTAATMAGAAIGTAIGGQTSKPASPSYQMIKKCNSIY